MNDWVTVDDEEIFPRGWTYWNCGLVTVSTNHDDRSDHSHNDEDEQTVELNCQLRNKYHEMMRGVSFGEEFGSEGSDPVVGFLLHDPRYDPTIPNNGSDNSNKNDNRTHSVGNSNNNRALDEHWSGEDLRRIMKLLDECPISEHNDVWKKLETGEYAESYRALRAEMEKDLVGVKCFIVGEYGGLPFLILGLCPRTGALIGVASSVAWT